MSSSRDVYIKCIQLHPSGVVCQDENLDCYMMQFQISYLQGSTRMLLAVLKHVPS